MPTPLPLTTMQSASSFAEGDHVVKRKGDYTFDGVVISRFYKRSGAVRYAVENDAGIVHIFNGSQLELFKP